MQRYPLHLAPSLPRPSLALSPGHQQFAGTEKNGGAQIELQFPSHATHNQRVQAASRATGSRAPAFGQATAPTSSLGGVTRLSSSSSTAIEGRREHKGTGATSRLVVRRRCQEEGKQQQQGGEKEGQRKTFLTLEEAGLVEMSGLSTHERFLCRLTISSLNLLRVISEQEGVPIEELNAGRVCDWFVKDKLKREQNLGTAVLQWDDPGF
ncbi:hypothetical protein EJB05_24071 [Eragrostis curvula]|uniref:Uncharacterized protein n=1 Tax=Eragrostis curvula TaxID=38414 RepID=A0A5J9V8P7_9POAL|nr:hypothetical protein EJB05_24071 [Eragrostis curvula]